MHAWHIKGIGKQSGQGLTRALNTGRESLFAGIGWMVAGQTKTASGDSDTHTQTQIRVARHGFSLARAGGISAGQAAGSPAPRQQAGLRGTHRSGRYEGPAVGREEITDGSEGQREGLEGCGLRGGVGKGAGALAGKRRRVFGVRLEALGGQ